MILTFILTGLNDFLLGLINSLSTGGLPTGISDSLTYIVGIMNTFNWFFPLDTLFQVLGYVIIFELAVVSYRLMMWVYHLIRG